jgi:hypothetical protein
MNRRAADRDSEGEEEEEEGARSENGRAAERRRRREDEERDVRVRKERDVQLQEERNEALRYLYERCDAATHRRVTRRVRVSTRRHTHPEPSRSRCLVETRHIQIYRSLSSPLYATTINVCARAAS